MKFLITSLFITVCFSSYGQITVQPDSTYFKTRVGDCLTGTHPLYILDDKIFPCDSVRTIEPSDIEEIQILKGASAAALYGTNGSRNGTVVIITKKYAALRKREKEAAKTEKP